VQLLIITKCSNRGALLTRRINALTSPIILLATEHIRSFGSLKSVTRARRLLSNYTNRTTIDLPVVFKPMPSNFNAVNSTHLLIWKRAVNNSFCCGATTNHTHTHNNYCKNKSNHHCWQITQFFSIECNIGNRYTSQCLHSFSRKPQNGSIFFRFHRVTLVCCQPIYTHTYLRRFGQCSKRCCCFFWFILHIGEECQFYNRAKVVVFKFFRTSSNERSGSETFSNE
jgi:hypothetical protein